MLKQVQLPKIKELDGKTKQFQERDGKFGILNPHDYDPDTLLAMAYNDTNHRTYSRSLYAHTEFVPVDKAFELTQYMPTRYNQFNVKNLQQSLKEMPNDTYVSLGREGSVVVYFYTKYPDSVIDKLKTYNTRIDELDIIEKKYKYNTWELTNNNQYSLIRVWWD